MQVYEDFEGCRWKADKFIIERFESIYKYWSNLQFCLEALKQNCLALQYVKEQNGHAFEYVKEQKANS